MCNQESVTECGEEHDDYIVCSCKQVTYKQIVAAIKQGFCDEKSISAVLKTSTGCRSCIQEVQEIIEEELKKEKITD